MDPRALCEETDYKSVVPSFPSDSDLEEDTDTAGCGGLREHDWEVKSPEPGRIGEDRTDSESSSPVDVLITTNSKHLPDELASTNIQDGSHVVKWTVSIAIAIPKGEPVLLVEKAKKTHVQSSGVVEAPKALGYYHIEYNLLPGNQEPTKVDLVMFGVAAKMYTESETKVLKPWHDGDQLWLGWSQSIKVRVTKELLIKLVSHKITFRIWDTKDMMSAKASCSSRVYQGFCNITLNRPLISEELKAELNPLVITVLSASSLPSSPVPLHVLEEKCLPVYCQYWFHNMPMHRTKGQKHSANVYFQDVNVIMTGEALPGELMDFLQGPPVEIEVHDRDSKLEKALTTPALFGTEPNDDKLSSVVLVSGKQTNQNPFRERTKRYNPYGIAKLNLSDLLHGQCSLKVILYILLHICSLMYADSGQFVRKMAALPGTGVVDGQKEPAMPMGHYFDANSQLKVHVEIACPLKVGCDDGKTGCPFGRIIYLFKYTNISAMSLLRSELLRINALAFQLEDQSEETVERALSCYKMAVMERESRDLDVVTGFHLLDKQIHLFVLEGLKHKAIRRLWEAVPIKLTGSEEDQVIVLYNSSLSFYNRLYDLLDISFTPIHLHKPLETIMRQPLVYIRDMVPYPCFQLRMLKDVVQNNLFPSAEMILSMNKEFGVLDLGKWRQGLEGSRVVEAGVPSYHGPENPSCCLDTHNHLWRQHMHTKQPTLPERDRLPWLHRYGDMELYVKPPAFFSPVPPVTIHLPKAGSPVQLPHGWG
uniref:DUF4550 domain-containing protein n=1 Tax=Esox lucius TaxID=8010 RepID=A0A6Q2Y3U2_ESOLU